MTVRLATKDDIPALSRLMQTVQDVHAAAHPEIFLPQLDSAATAMFFAQLLGSDRNVLLVADDGPQVIGYVWCEERKSPPTFFSRASRVGYIHHVAVDPGRQRRGIGRSLVEATRSELRARGATRLGIDHWTFNVDASAFFEKLGFRKQRQTYSGSL